MTEIQPYIGYAAGILGLIPFWFYIVSMKLGSSKPNLAGVLIYTFAMTMIIASSIALHAWQALWLAVAYIFGQSLVIIISFKTGYFAFSKFDYGCILISVASLFLWIHTSNPLYALLLNVIVDALGTVAIAKKLYTHPKTEDTTAWTMALLVSVLNLFAIPLFNIENALYPIYLVVANVLIVSLSLRKP